MVERDEILATALTMPPGSVRTAYVETATAANPELRGELLKLLEVHDEAGSFLELAAWEQDCTLVSAEQPAGQSDALEQILAQLPRPDGGEGLAILAHFLLLELLGEGGSACVFRARDQRLQREVAVKVLKPALAANSRQRQRFLDESKMIAGLRAEHIVDVYEVGEHHSLTYFVMEYLPEGSLQSCLSKRGPLNLREALTVAGQVLDALQVAHSRGLLHRDIKPSNVLVDRFPDRVKLGDFGLARAVILEAEDRVIGTPQFSSPEQIRGEAVDERTDLFGFGCLIFSLLVGHSPFAGTSRLQTIQMTLELDPEPLSHFGVQVPVAFQQLLDSLLAKSRSDRPRDLQLVQQQLQQLLADTVAERRPDRRKWLWAAGAMALAGGGGLFAFWRLRPQRPRPVLPLSRAVNLKHDDGSLAPFLVEQQNATLVTMERLTLTRPIYYWRPTETGKEARVTYRFDFDQTLKSCRLKCSTYLATVYDPKAWSRVWVGANLDEMHAAISLQFHRAEFWPEPGVSRSIPVISTEDISAIYCPKRWIDVSQLLAGKRSLYLQAEFFASREVLTWSKASLGPAGAQFLRTNPETGEIAVILEARG